MKKVYFLTTLLMYFFAGAQEVNYGVKAGANVSSLSVNPKLGDTNPFFGFHVGAIAEIKLNDKMSIQPELLYSKEGGEYFFRDNITNISFIYKQKINLSKINLPILFKYYVIKNLSLQAGPQIDYIVSAKSDVNVTIAPGIGKFTGSPNLADGSTPFTFLNYIDNTESYDVISQKYGLKKLNFGFNLGTEYDLNSGIFFQARYTIGLTKFVDNGNFLAGTDSTGAKFLDNRYDNTTFKSSNIQISVGYKF